VEGVGEICFGWFWAAANRVGKQTAIIAAMRYIHFIVVNALLEISVCMEGIEI
jgi:hypothetical protein